MVVVLWTADASEVEIAEMNPEKKIMVINTTCKNQDGVVVLEGQATVKRLE